MAFRLEKFISGIGGIVSIGTVLAATLYVEGLAPQLAQFGMLPPFLAASMGATAVLLFAAPHAPLSQPWNVIGGHLLSALVAVTVYSAISDQIAGAALSVGIAITVMYFAGCLHPPGGATALIPFLSGPLMDNYGSLFILFPIGVGAVLMVAIAIIFNYPFGWRRYPLSLRRELDQERPDDVGNMSHHPDITHADFVAALSEVETYVDISEEELLAIYRIACRHTD